MKTSKISFLFLLATFFINACQEKENVVPAGFGFKTPVIHGFWMRDYNGSPMGYYGNPNIKISNEAGLSMNCFPNPACNIWRIYFRPESALEKKIWIVHATTDPDYDPAPYALGALPTRIGGVPVYEITTYGNEINIPADNLYNGYYKIYCVIGDDLLHDNLVRDTSMYYCGNK